MQKKYGLIGFPLSHTFSPSYFRKKFEDEGITNCDYQSYELSSIGLIQSLFEDQEIVGLNVTIPYKEQVIPFLDELSEEAEAIGAVNTIKIQDGKKIGFNTDVYGFEQSILEQIGDARVTDALILGTGGAAKAVHFVLNKLGMKVEFISRSNEQFMNYTDLMNKLNQYQLVVNTTPLGMKPNVTTCPDIPYDEITSNHFFFDLIYNPEKTLFLERAEVKGAKIMNGHKMLILQAEKSWQIWND